MDLENLKSRLRGTMTRKRDFGLKQIREQSQTDQLPISFDLLYSLVITSADRKLCRKHSITIIDLISTIALELGMDRVSSVDEKYIAWDIPERRAPTPFGESKIQFTPKQVPVIKGIPEKHRRGHGPDDLYTDPTYTIKDA